MSTNVKVNIIVVQMPLVKTYLDLTNASAKLKLKGESVVKVCIQSPSYANVLLESQAMCTSL